MKPVNTKREMNDLTDDTALNDDNTYNDDNNGTEYPIGTTGVAWGTDEKQQWLTQSVKQRSYRELVVSELEKVSKHFDKINYGALSINPAHYPLMALKSNNWSHQKPTILITGGVHGYETSGVHGALDFAKLFDNVEQGKTQKSIDVQLSSTNKKLNNYLDHVNILIMQCISPWGYEHIARWNPYTVDPNRSFVANSLSEESALAMKFIAEINGEKSAVLKNDILLHIDLHETTDSDETEFCPALAARDGKVFEPGAIPDGFYLVADSENTQIEFQTAIINAVKGVTHIAPCDKNNQIIGTEIVAEGIICYPVKSLGLCAGMTNAIYSTTTEVYPDSEKVTDADCNKAQVTAICAAIDYVIEKVLRKKK